MTGLPRTQQGNDALWVIIDILTKLAHFLPIKVSFLLEKLAELYVREVVRLHGVPCNKVLVQQVCKDLVLLIIHLVGEFMKGNARNNL